MAHFPGISPPEALALEKLYEAEDTIQSLKTLKLNQNANQHQLMDNHALMRGQEALTEAGIHPNSHNAQPATTSTDDSEVTATTMHTEPLSALSRPSSDTNTNNVHPNSQNAQPATTSTDDSAATTMHTEPLSELSRPSSDTNTNNIHPNSQNEQPATTSTEGSEVTATTMRAEPLSEFSLPSFHTDTNNVHPNSQNAQPATSSTDASATNMGATCSHAMYDTSDVLTEPLSESSLPNSHTNTNNVHPNSQNAQPATTSTDASATNMGTTSSHATDDTSDIHTALLSEFNLSCWDTYTDHVNLAMIVPEHNYYVWLNEEYYYSAEESEHSDNDVDSDREEDSENE